MNLLKRLLISTIIVLLLAYFLNGVSVANPLTAVIVAVVMALLNTFLKPILVFFTLPVTIFSLGLFLLVINAAMVLLCDKLVDGFEVATFFTALLFSVFLSISQWVLYKFIKD
ncbi:phage holin family protein [Flavobacterium amnicola]|uniref:Phage holin family protein n=1 Tax=Flavobacterium amnicola TaxID=2506422 RepID=A0A4V1N2C4_9FLAO|nr:phage holin family protein [Flavobacterium amnicola]RXR21231.1 phage holin family protein [Flavobacterium amnicola]